MPDYIIYLIYFYSGAFLSIAGAFAGVFIMFRGKESNSESTHSFLGKAKKGKVFTIPTEGVPEFPTEPKQSKEEKHVLGKTTDFLKNLGGKV